MSMFTYAEIVLGVMVAVYIVAKAFKLSTELAMFAAALGGALAGGFGLPPRHIAEGAMTYLDINLIFITATLFMNILKDSGGVAFAVRGILTRFHWSRTILVILLTVLLLLPGALTGAGSVTVLITGGMVAVVLETMGVSRVRTAAIVFIIAGLSAAAPPVSLWAMMTAAGVNMPYVGFFWPLLLPCVLLSLATIFLLGWRGEKIDLEKALEELISRETVHQLLPLIGTLTCVGVLVQIMTLTGVRGLLAVTAVTLPVALVFTTLFLVLPVSEAVLMWGAAPVLGVPLVLLFNTIGLDPIVALAGMSVIWPLGDALPPTAIIGRLTVDVVDYRESYVRFLKACIVPALVIMAVGTLMVVYSTRLSFLTGL
jgi:CitMHS family citrate-Mg2+:H+ or citrate-Ca2+:H+ symporter